MNDRLVRLFAEMSAHTAPECATNCSRPHSCCSPEYCDMAIAIANEDGVSLEKTDHPTLPLMGLQGCTAAPHFRPLCTLHTCAVNSFGFKPGDRAWTKKYFDLRLAIEKEESTLA